MRKPKNKLHVVFENDLSFRKKKKVSLYALLGEVKRDYLHLICPEKIILHGLVEEALYFEENTSCSPFVKEVARPLLKTLRISRRNVS